MNVNDFLNGLNEYYKDNNLNEVEKWLEFWEVQSREKRDLGVLLVVLNEKMNFCKGTGALEKGCDAFLEACGVVDVLGLSGSVASATTLVNGAGLFWSTGDCEKALKLYAQAEEVYESCDITDTYENAGIYNDMSILYEELEQYPQAAQCQTLVVEILGKLTDCEEELLAAYGNLGQLTFKTGAFAESAEAFKKAAELSEKMLGTDDETTRAILENYEAVSKMVKEQ